MELNQGSSQEKIKGGLCVMHAMCLAPGIQGGSGGMKIFDALRSILASKKAVLLQPWHPSLAFIHSLASYML